MILRYGFIRLLLLRFIREDEQYFQVTMLCLIYEVTISFLFVTGLTMMLFSLHKFDADALLGLDMWISSLMR